MTRIPNRQTDTRVAEILGLLDSPAVLDDGMTGPLLADLERERRRLHHALSLLRVARQKLHEQYLSNQDQQKRVIADVQREWASRRRQMESQLATAAMAKAREELAEERAHLEAEFQQRDMEWRQESDTREREWDDVQTVHLRDHDSEHERLNGLIRKQQDETESLRLQLQGERDRHARTLEEHHAELLTQQSTLRKQMNDIRGQLVQAELALVKDRAEWADERRRWTDERTKAESIIQDLLIELESRSKTKPQKLAA